MKFKISCKILVSVRELTLFDNYKGSGFSETSLELFRLNLTNFYNK